MQTTRILAIALPAALFGAGTVLCWQWFYLDTVRKVPASPAEADLPEKFGSWRAGQREVTEERSTGQGRVTNPVRQEFIAAQELSLTDAAGDPLGRLDVSTGQVTLYLYYTGSGGGYVLARVYSDSSRVFLECAGRDREATDIIVGPNSVDISDLKRGNISGAWPISKPTKGKRFDDEWILPTEDLRLQDRQGWVFASLGLAKDGAPGLAVADASHAVRMAWFQRELLNDPYWEIAVLDESGEPILNLQFRTDGPPNLFLYVNRLPTSDVLDFGTHEFTNDGAIHTNTLGWLPPLQIRPQAPIRLLDNRGKVLWSAQ